MSKQKYYVRLIENNFLSPRMAKEIKKLELDTYEEKFPYEKERIEVYKIGTKSECKMFIEKIPDKELQRQFEVVKAPS